MPPRLSDEVRRRVVELLRQSKTILQIVGTIGADRISTATISRVAKEHGIPLTRGARRGAPNAGRPKGIRTTYSPYRERVLEMHASGLLPADIARVLGISRQWVSKILDGN